MDIEVSRNYQFWGFGAEIRKQFSHFIKEGEERSRRWSVDSKKVESF